MNFAAADQEISYTLNAAQDGYLVSGCDENAVLLVLPAVHNGLPVVGTAETPLQTASTCKKCAWKRKVYICRFVTAS